MVLRAAVVWVLAAVWASAQNGSPPVEHLMDEVSASASLEKNLRVLCDEIGGRLPGTPAMKRAVDWAVGAFRRAGLTRVHTESFPVPHSWAEGASRAEVLAPVAFGVRVAAAGWSAATPNGGIEAEVVLGGRGDEGEIPRLGERAKGKILLIRSETLQSFYDMAVEQRRATVAIREAEKAGAAAVLLMSTRPKGLLYRHTTAIDGRLDKIPIAVAAREEALRVLRLLEDSQQVRMRLSLPNRTGGPAEAQNVVAEIRGRENPEEVIILGAHLDSWDLGTGCLDNGCNVAMILEVARAIQATRPPPRRTVRFVLFGAEEQGLLGSRAYVRAHRAEMDQIVAVVVHDIGVGKISGYSLGGRREIETAVAESLGPVASRGVTAHTGDAFFGTDHFDFLLEGVPTLVANQDTSEYVPNYHAQSDTFDKVDLAELKNVAAIAAVAVYNLADRPERPAARLDRAGVERLLRDTRLDDQMKFLGLWEEWVQGERGRTGSR
jgi:Iap family predicted aminopeptidase